MIKHVFLLGLITGAIAASPAVAAPHTELRTLGLASSDDGAGVTLELSQRTAYKLFMLDKPTRVVLDLRDTRLARSAHIPQGAGVVERIRAAPRAPATLRV